MHSVSNAGVSYPQQHLVLSVILILVILVGIQFSSVTQSCPTLCNPMDCSTPGLAVPHQLLELGQTHVHRVDDSIQPSHPLSPFSPPGLSLSQCIFQWVSPLYQVAKILELQLQHQPFQSIFRVDFLLRLTGLIFLLSKGLSRVFPGTTIQKHQFFSAQPSFWSNSHDWRR